MKHGQGGTMQGRKWGLLVIAAACISVALHGQAPTTDAQVQADVQQVLKARRYGDIKATATNGTVLLTGNVDLYATKEEAEQRIHHRQGVVAVSNRITVGSAANPTAITDVELRNRLAEKLAYDRIGYATTVYDSLSVGVQNGVVLLGGTAYGAADKDSAVSLVAHTPGVKDVVDDIEVASVSPADDRMRIEAARAIYGVPALGRYALDPARPIRITVVNGVITLTGVVASSADRDLAGSRTKSVAGAVKVVNSLQIATPATDAR